MFPQLFLLLPTLASCSITITIQTFSNHSNTWIHATGNFSSSITEKERVTFGLTKEFLSKAAKNLNGITPLNVYQYEPAPVDDLNKPEVTRVLVPVKSEFVNDAAETSVHGPIEDIQAIDFRVSRSNAKIVLSNSIQIIPLTDDYFDVDENINYYVEGFTKIECTTSWGNNKVNNTRVAFEADYVLYDPIHLETGQEVVGSYETTLITLTILIQYSAKLVGEAVFRCPHTYKHNKDCSYRSYDINDVLRAGGYPTTVEAAQLIKIQYHTHARMVLTDKVTKENIAVIRAELNPLRS